jgi:hypothetical protein
MHLAIVRADGGVSVMWLPDDADAEREVSRWQETHPSLAVSYAVIDPLTLPASRRWRQAWRLADGVVGVDLTAARAVRKEELLAERDRFVAMLGPRIDAAQDAGDAAEEVRLRQRRREAAGLDGVLAGRLELFTLEELADYEPP